MNTSHAIAGTIFSSLVYGVVWWKLKNISRTFYMFFDAVIWVVFWTQEDVTETSMAFLGKKNSENAVFVGSRFPALGGGSLDKTFSNAKSFDSYTRKRSKKSHILTEEVWTLVFVPICLILTSILFQFIFASFFWSGQVEVQIKAHAGVARFLSFKVNCF